MQGFLYSYIFSDSKKLATHSDVTVAAYVFIPGNNNTVTRDGFQATDGW